MTLELSLLGEILNLARDPDVNLEEFRDLVARSPKLATEIVKIANSALYGMEGKIHRLERAVLILGIRTVSQIASTLLVADIMRGVEIGGVSSDALWMHSLETGVCTQLLARWLGLPFESEAYLCGLIHDLGVVDLFAEYGEAYAEIVRKSVDEDVALTGLEQSRFSETHGQRLASRAEAWDFPDILKEAVEHHDTPEEASPLGKSLAQLLYASHELIENPLAGWRDAAPSGGVLLKDLGLDERDIRDIREELQVRMKDVVSVF